MNDVIASLIVYLLFLSVWIPLCVWYLKQHNKNWNRFETDARKLLK